MLEKLIFLSVVTVLSSLPGFAFQDARSLSSTHQRRGNMILTLAGRVLGEDGAPPAELVQVDLLCSGRLRNQTLTSADGSFVFEIGSARDEDWLDPSLGGSANGSLESTVKVASSGRSPNLDEVPSMGRGRVNLSGCEIRLAPRTAYTANSITLTTRSTGDNPDVGVILMRKISQGASATVSLSILSAPRKAREAFEKATQELRKEKPDLGKIRQRLERALKAFPLFSAAWDLMARVEMTEGNEDAARQAFIRATEAEPRFIQPYLGLAQVAVRRSNWEEAARWSEKILKIDPARPQGLYWHGLAYFYLSRFSEAEPSLAKLFQVDQGDRYAFALLPLGVIHANQGRLAEAVEEIQRYLDQMPPEQVPEAQRSELEKQIALWRAQGVVAKNVISAIPPKAPE